MSKTFTVETTDLEDKAVRWAERDPQKWLELVVKNRAKAAMTELYSLELKKALEDPNTSSLSPVMEEVVLASKEPTCKDKNETIRQTVVTPPPTATAEELAAHALEAARLTQPSVVADTPRSFLGGNFNA